MKKILLSVITMIVLNSCTDLSNQWNSNFTKRNKVTDYNGLQVFQVDDCEYLKYENAQGLGICHKENCSNPIHKQKQK